jgi:hypothetical protein
MRRCLNRFALMTVREVWNETVPVPTTLLER